MSSAHRIKLIILGLLLFPVALFAQTSTTGRIDEGPLAGRPTVCTPGDYYVTTDTNPVVEYKCSIGNIWNQESGGGGGGAPGGVNGDTQCKNGAIFVACSQTPGVIYVASTGNDTNSGKTWDTAKLTIYAALQALPNGSAGTAGVGTVYVADGSSANPTSGAGIWLMSSADPNFASPPAGWLKCDGPTCVPTIIGVPAGSHDANPHKGRAFVSGGNNSDNNHPGLWLSGQQNPVWISNIAFGSNTGRSIVLGECSNNATTGCGVAGITIENVGGAAGTTATQGPCTTITGASFWVWLRDFGCSGNAVNATGGATANNAAAILINGTGNNGNGLIYIQDSNFVLGGIKDIPGTTTPDTIYVTDVTEEGDFTHTIPPVVWFTSQFVQAIVKNPQMADPGASPPPAVQSDGISTSGTTTGVTVIGNGITVQGKATVIGSNANGASFLLNGTVGPTQGYMLGQNDISRRGSPLASNRFANNGFSNTASWTLPAGGGTITSAVLDPLGGTTAGTVAGTPAAGTLIIGCKSSYTPTAGDWLVMGAWVRNETSVNGLQESTCTGGAIGWTNATRLTNNNGLPGDNNNGAWDWLWIADKVASNAAATSVAFGPIVGTGNLPSAYGPVLYVVPAGTLTDAEIAEMLYSMNSVDSACPAGSICDVSGHPLNVGALSIRTGGVANAVTDWPTSTTLGSIVGNVTGQALTASTGIAPSFVSPGLPDGNGGVAVTTTPYTIQCDSGTALIDRAHVLRFQPGALVVNVPLSTATGCAGGFVVSVMNDGVSQLTFNRTSPDTFSIFTGGTSIDSATSFTLNNGQHATLSQGATGLWEVRISATLYGGALVDAANPPYNVVPGNAWLDATWTNGSNTVTIGASDAPFTSAMNGWLCGGTSGTVTGAPTDANSVLVKTLGTFTFTSATAGTCSGTAANASASGTNNGVLVMGPDDTAGLAAAWNAATGGTSGTGQSQCGTLQLPPGILFTKTGQFNTVNCNNAMTGATTAGVWIYGWGRTSTRIVPAFDQFNFTGVTFNSKNCLFFCHNGINVNQLAIWGAGYQNTGTNTVAVVGCSTDSQYNQFEIAQWGMADTGPFIGFWVPSGVGCAPVNSMTIAEMGSIGCEFDGPANISTLECGPSGKRSVVINATVRSNLFVSGLPGYASGSTASTTDGCTGAAAVVCIGSGGVWYSNGGDQIGGNSSNVGIDIRSGGTLVANALSTNYGSNLGMDIENGGVAFGCNSFFGGAATGIAVNGGGIYRSNCGNNFFSTGSLANSIQVVSGTAQVILNPLDGWNGTNQAVPTISGTVFGTSPTVGTCSSGLNQAEAGCALVTEGTSPPSSGTVILTFNQTYQYTALPVCTLSFRNGTGSWNVRANAITTTQSSTAYTWTVDNNAVALTAASTYGVIWHCIAR